MYSHLTEMKSAGLLAAFLPGEVRTSVQNAELQSRQTKLAVKQRQLELANRRAALAALTFENTDRQRHLQGNTAAARRAAD